MTIEDAAELKLRQPHVVRLEARPPNLEGRGEVTIRQLVRNALRMRPDRIVVGEVRGPEALDMLQALNTGHEGSLTTVHANSPAGRAAPGRDARADGRGRAAARRGARAARERASSSWCTRRAAPTGGEGRVRRRGGARAGGAAGTRELYRLTDGGAGSARAAGQRAGAASRGRAVTAAAALAFSAGAPWAPGRGRGRRRRGRALPGLARALAALGQVVARVGSEGRDPAAAERRRLLAAGAGALLLVGLLVGGPIAGVGLAAGGPWLVGRLLRARRERYRRAVDDGAAAVALALADALGGGHSLRGALHEAARGVPGAARARAAPRVGRAGGSARGPTTRSRPCAGAALPPSTRSWPPACFSDARGAIWRDCCGSSAHAFEDQSRLEAEVRAATAQARFTGLLVVLLPLGGALLAELASPGYLRGLAGSFLTPGSAALPLALQALAAVLIRRLARVAT